MDVLRWQRDDLLLHDGSEEPGLRSIESMMPRGSSWTSISTTQKKTLLVQNKRPDEIFANMNEQSVVGSGDVPADEFDPTLSTYASSYHTR